MDEKPVRTQATANEEGFWWCVSGIPRLTALDVLRTGAVVEPAPLPAADVRLVPPGPAGPTPMLLHRLPHFLGGGRIAQSRYARLDSHVTRVAELFADLSSNLYH